MDNDIKFENNKPRNNKALAGIILLVVGLALLANSVFSSAAADASNRP